MEDEKTMVSMSLKRFKELESYENVFNALSKNENFIWYNRWGGGYVVSKDMDPPAVLVRDLKEAIETRDCMIDKVRAYEDKTGNKVFP